MKKEAEKETPKVDETKAIIEGMTKLMIDNQKMMMLDNQKMMNFLAQSLMGQPITGSPAAGQTSVGGQATTSTIHRTQGAGRGRGQYSSNESGTQGGPTCFNCGQRGHYRNECPELPRPAGQVRPPWGTFPRTMPNVDPLLSNQPHQPVAAAVHTVQMGAINPYVEDDNEGSGTLGVRVVGNHMVEVEEVATVDKRGREASSSGETQTQRPVGKKVRIEEGRSPTQMEKDTPPIQPRSERPVLPVKARVNARVAMDGAEDTIIESMGETEAIPKEKKRRKRRNPLEVVIRTPRMMSGDKPWHYVKTIKEIPVPLTMGQLLTVAPMVRAGLAYSMVIPREGRKSKGKQPTVTGKRSNALGKQPSVPESSQVTVQSKDNHTRQLIGQPQYTQQGQIIPETAGEVVNFYTEGLINGEYPLL